MSLCSPAKATWLKCQHEMSSGLTSVSSVVFYLIIGLSKERGGKGGGLDEMYGGMSVGDGRMERQDRNRGIKVRDSDNLCQSNFRFVSCPNALGK